MEIDEDVSDDEDSEVVQPELEVELEIVVVTHGLLSHRSPLPRTEISPPASVTMQQVSVAMVVEPEFSDTLQLPSLERSDAGLFIVNVPLMMLFLHFDASTSPRRWIVPSAIKIAAPLRTFIMVLLFFQFMTVGLIDEDFHNNISYD